ncbi:unnamed protein product, partial [Cyprideis torosa]
MNRIRITKHFDFETAHALYGYDGKCKNIHGHSYHLHVTVIGTPIEDPDHPKNGMVMDFGDLKKIVKEEIVVKFDHAVVLNSNSPHRELAKTIEDHSHKIVLVPYQPTNQHFGIPDPESSRVREVKFISWLDEIKEDAECIFLLGDLFDFWFEYKKVVPRGFVRVLGKIAELRDSGIPIYFFVGNHDLWMGDYFQKELDIPVFDRPKEFDFGGKRFLIGHGDGLGPGDKGYKRMKK